MKFNFKFQLTFLGSCNFLQGKWIFKYHESKATFTDRDLLYLKNMQHPWGCQNSAFNRCILKFTYWIFKLQSTLSLSFSLCLSVSRKIHGKANNYKLFLTLIIASQAQQYIKCTVKDSKLDTEVVLVFVLHAQLHICAIYVQANKKKQQKKKKIQFKSTFKSKQYCFKFN